MRGQPFGFSPKISTTVENTVEKRVCLQTSTGSIRLFRPLLRFARWGGPDFRRFAVTKLLNAHYIWTFSRRKSPAAQFTGWF
jgi:hypothetical protein